MRLLLILIPHESVKYPMVRAPGHLDSM